MVASKLVGALALSVSFLSAASALADEPVSGTRTNSEASDKPAVAAASRSDGATDSKATGKTATTSASYGTTAAQDADRSEPDSLAHLTGLELSLTPSFGGAGAGSPVTFVQNGSFSGDPGAIANGTSSPYSSGFIGHAMVGYRFHPLVSAGLRAGLRTQSGSNPSDGTSGLSRTAWDAGFYARAYPLALMASVRKYIDPWVGVGVGYMRDTQTFQAARSLPVTETLDHHAIAVPLGIGVDYRVLPMLSVGPSFEYTLANSVAGCGKFDLNVAGGSHNSYCSNEAPGKDFVKSANYGVWSAGLDMRATF